MFGTYFKEKRKAALLTQGEVAEFMGCDRVAISNWENGKNFPDPKKVFKLAELLGVPLHEIMSQLYRPNDLVWKMPELQSALGLTSAIREGKRRANEAEADHLSNEPSEDEFSLIPQLDLSASCGSGRFVDHVVVKGGLAFKRSFLARLGVSEDKSRVIYAEGQSMEPTIGDGCVVLIDLSSTSLIDGKVFLICDPDSANYMKRMVREYSPQLGGMAWIMRSDNPNKKDHPDKLLPQDDRTVIIGRAVWNDNML